MYSVHALDNVDNSDDSLPVQVCPLASAVARPRSSGQAVRGA